MPGGNAIEVEGAVVETLPNGLYRVELPNGHRVLAHVARRQRDAVTFAPGSKVNLAVSFYDLSHGRILCGNEVIK